MPTQTSKSSGLKTWPVGEAGKTKLIDLQRKYRKKYGENIPQDKIAEILLQKASLQDLPTPTDLKAEAKIIQDAK